MELASPPNNLSGGPSKARTKLDRLLSLRLAPRPRNPPPLPAGAPPPPAFTL